MYVGMALSTLGIVLAAGSVWGFLGLVASLLVVRHYVIAREERHLDATYGDDYRAYCARVRRWI